MKGDKHVYFTALNRLSRVVYGPILLKIRKIGRICTDFKYNTSEETQRSCYLALTLAASQMIFPLSILRAATIVGGERWWKIHW